MPESTHLLCVVCSDPVDPEIAHSLHEADCPRAHLGGDPDGQCSCHVVAHPECCPELACQDIGNGHTIELDARFLVPRWFTVDQVNELARGLCDFVANNGQPVGVRFLPDPESTCYDDDTPYVCAASAAAVVKAGSGNGGAFGTQLVVWGHDDRCRSCHHAQGDHDPTTEGCLVDGCDCIRWEPYRCLVDIGGGAATSSAATDITLRHARSDSLLGLLAKRLDRRPDGTAALTLSVRFVAALDEYASNGPKAERPEAVS